MQRNENNTVRDPILQELIDEVQSLVGDLHWWDDGVIGVFGTLTRSLEKRLKEWLQFFQDRYTLSICMYRETALAIFHAFDNWDVICNQSEDSFQRSLSFYDVLLKSTKFISIQEFTVARHLLKVSLIVGNYPKSQNVSADKAVFGLDGELGHEDVSDVFIKLFVKWEIPQYLVYNLDDLDFDSVDMLMYHLTGKNIRTYPELPYPLSKKEADILINHLPKEYEFGYIYGSKAILASKLLASNRDGLGFLGSFLSGAHDFNHEPNTFFQNFEWWKRLFQFVTSESFFAVNEHSIPEIIDYCAYENENNPKGFSLKGRTPASLIRLVSEWHDDFDFEFTSDKRAWSWKAHYGDFQLNSEGMIWILKELSNGDELFEESHKMRHCVFSYIDRCVNGDVCIFSLIHENGGELFRIATAEFSANQFVQVRGKLNSEVAPDVLKVLDQFTVLMANKKKEDKMAKEEEEFY